MSKHERACYFYDQHIEFYCVQEDKGVPVYELEKMDKDLFFEMKALREKRKQEKLVEQNVSPDEVQPNTTIDAVFGFH